MPLTPLYPHYSLYATHHLPHNTIFQAKTLIPFPHSIIHATMSQRFTIGYALAEKKQHSFIQTSLLSLASQRGIDMIKIDTKKSLSSQGPFHCIIHKIPQQSWIQELNFYSENYPNVIIIDQPCCIERVHNRVSMLQVVDELRDARDAMKGEEATFGVPKQIVVTKESDLCLDDTILGLKFPVISKPIMADGSGESHKMSLVFNKEGLKKLKVPTVLQEFVNHGGVIFKVYVVGEYVKCVKRKSLPDVSEERLRSLEGSMSFSQISNLPTHERVVSGGAGDDNGKGGGDEGDFEEKSNELDQMEMPPLSFLTEIARGLGKAMGLHLFNFDILRDVKVGNHYLVIDINYFPGYAKMPDYENVLTDFFLDIAAGKVKDVKSGVERIGSEMVHDIAFEEGQV